MEKVEPLSHARLYPFYTETRFTLLSSNAEVTGNKAGMTCRSCLCGVCVCVGRGQVSAIFQ